MNDIKVNGKLDHVVQIHVCRKSYASHSFVAFFLLLLLFFIIPFLGGSSRSEILLNVD